MVRGPAELSALNTILQRHRVPSRLAFEVEAQRCIVKYHDSLIGEAETCVRETLVQLCEQEMNNLVNQYRSSMDNFTALSYHTTQLHLYALALLKEKQHLDNEGNLAAGCPSATYKQLGMIAAQRLIDIYCNEIGSSDPRLIETYRALPKKFFIGVLLAAFFLLRYFVLNPACQGERKNACRNYVLMVYSKLREFTSHQFAEPGRAATVIEVLCRHGD